MGLTTVFRWFSILVFSLALTGFVIALSGCFEAEHVNRKEDQKMLRSQALSRIQSLQVKENEARLALIPRHELSMDHVTRKQLKTIEDGTQLLFENLFESDLNLKLGHVPSENTSLANSFTETYPGGIKFLELENCSYQPLMSQNAFDQYRMYGGDGEITYSGFNCEESYLRNTRVNDYINYSVVSNIFPKSPSFRIEMYTVISLPLTLSIGDVKDEGLYDNNYFRNLLDKGLILNGVVLYESRNHEYVEQIKLSPASKEDQELSKIITQNNFSVDNKVQDAAVGRDGGLDNERIYKFGEIKINESLTMTGYFEGETDKPLLRTLLERESVKMVFKCRDGDTSCLQWIAPYPNHEIPFSISVKSGI